MYVGDRRQALYAAVLLDVLENVGFPDQRMRPFARPLHAERTVCGRLRRGLFEPHFGERPGVHSYDVEIALMHDLNSRADGRRGGGHHGQRRLGDGRSYGALSNPPFIAWVSPVGSWLAVRLPTGS
jgi:hypothetical protein